MAGLLIFLLIGCLLHGTKFDNFEVSLPYNVQVMKGSCVTIPCSFDIKKEFEGLLTGTCVAKWIIYWDQTAPQLTNTDPVTADLSKKDCTTTFNKMQPNHNKTYFFRLECSSKLKWTFANNVVNIKVTDNPPLPTLIPSTLKVKEGAFVSLTCFAQAPCISYSPTLTWTPRLGDTQETLQKNQDKTQFKTSVLTFTASRFHHGQKISCTAVYKKQIGSPDASVTTDLTAMILFPPVILDSSNCTRTTSQVNCSCETVGSSPTLQWLVDGQQVNQSNKIFVINEPLNSTYLRSVITVNDPQDRHLSSLFCFSFNSVGSAGKQFCVDCQGSSADKKLMYVFIATTVLFLAVVCVLLFVIRFLKLQPNNVKNTVAEKGKKVPDTEEAAIYVNTRNLRQAK